MLLPKVLGMGSNVQSGLELIVRARIKKFWILARRRMQV